MRVSGGLHHDVRRFCSFHACLGQVTGNKSGPYSSQLDPSVAAHALEALQVSINAFFTARAQSLLARLDLTPAHDNDRKSQRLQASVGMQNHLGTVPCRSLAGARRLMVSTVGTGQVIASYGHDGERKRRQ